MSTLKVATIADTSGNNGTAPEEISKGRAKAWVSFNGGTNINGLCEVRSSYNLTSVSDLGVGDYGLNFVSGAFDSANYAATAMCRDTGHGSVMSVNIAQTDYTTSQLKISVTRSSHNSSHHDSAVVHVAIFGGN